jgi:RAB protein geranylgeranyltransferase component A
MEELKDAYFDIVITKTGLPESVLAALLASSGKSVLHLDANPFYGSDW